MAKTEKFSAHIIAFILLGLLSLCPVQLRSENAASALSIVTQDLAGTVTSPKGPEPGVWVIAETTDLPSKFAKIVVTDEQGRYLLPDIPKANYRVWVRGYGLVDSPKVQAKPGTILDLTAVIAPNVAAAAEYYPAIYWYSLLKIPDKSAFPGTGAKGNGLPETLKSQQQWLEIVKTDGCFTCHQLGDKATRTIPPQLGHFSSSLEAWERRIQSGQASGAMVNAIARLDSQPALRLFADWTDRIAAGDLPAEQPPRPQGVERNIVISIWDWATPTAYLHDEIATDKRNPMVNAYGAIYGAPEESTDFAPILDPERNITSQVKLPVQDPKTPSTADDTILAPSPYWGNEAIWNSQANAHNPMLDELGRVWFTARIRPPDNPSFCKKGSELISTKLFPLETSGRQAAVYDPKSKTFALVDTCFSTHHLQFDAHNVLWFSSGGGGGVVGWLDRKIFDETGDAAKAQGWTALILDTNGNGRRDDYVEPDQPVDPAKDKRINAAFYGIAPSPVDGTIWGSVVGYPGGIARISLGPNPPATALTEYYEAPWNDPHAAGYSPRGMDIDTNGVVWASLASGHLASFDRRKCKGPLNGPSATGGQCPEGWTLYPFPGPQFKGLTDSGSAESSYYTWVDQHDTFGLGPNVPIATGNASDALLALVDGKFVILRVPYPIGFYAKALDGRIDDEKAGWKGKGLWSTYGTRTPFHIEGGKGTSSKVVRFQLRPDPLAR
ncbi:MAG: carboxypeptidase-like regulatory domain-containing protein [Alphaproteobacteria bacterium]|nr:carboxypeptidase-like regulatory domain-containing protein [Alphaproteobacteria bacterium]